MTAGPLLIQSTHPSPFEVGPKHYGNLTLFVYLNSPFQVNLGPLDRAGPRARHSLQLLVTLGLTYADGSYIAKLAHVGGLHGITSLGFSLFTRRY